MRGARLRRDAFFSHAINKGSANRLSWTNEEIKALVQYICLYWPQAWNDKLPVTKDHVFWDSCAGAVNTSCKSNRKGMKSLCLVFQFTYYKVYCMYRFCFGYSIYTFCNNVQNVALVQRFYFLLMEAHKYSCFCSYLFFFTCLTPDILLVNGEALQLNGLNKIFWH